MNPATDVGKRDLPVGVRNRFTELFVDELIDKDDLLVLVQSYLQGLSLSSAVITNIVQFYIDVRRNSISFVADTSGRYPHYR
jgi:midasin